MLIDSPTNEFPLRNACDLFQLFLRRNSFALPPSEKFKIAPKYHGIAMQTYYGGRSETRIRCTEVPVVPVDFTSEYPTCCALLDLFDILTAESVAFEDDTKNIRKLLNKISLDRCFDPAIWKEFRFFALVEPDDGVLPVRTVYDGVTQNIGNNYLTSKTPLWFAGCDLIASAIRIGSPRAFFVQFASFQRVSKLT